VITVTATHRATTRVEAVQCDERGSPGASSALWALPNGEYRHTEAAETDQGRVTR